MSNLLVGRLVVANSRRHVPGARMKFRAWKDFKSGCGAWLSSSFSTTKSSDGPNGGCVDVLIVGGGVVGSALARLLNQEIPSLQVGLVEARSGPTLPPPNQEATSTCTPPPHPRSYALSPHSLQVLGMDAASHTKLGSYSSMQVWEANSPANLIFTTDDMPNPQHSYLGAVVEDAVLLQHLWTHLRQSSAKTRIWTNTTVQDIQSTQGPMTTVQLKTQDDHTTTVQTRLLVAADGGQSQLRQRLGIPKLAWHYGQRALTFTVQLQSDMNGRAFQRFLTQGPMALLPTHSPQHAIVVWTMTPSQAQYYQAAPNQQLLQQLNRSLQTGPERLPSLFDSANPISQVVDAIQYGLTMAAFDKYNPHPHHSGFTLPPLLESLESPVFGFDLSCQHVTNYFVTHPYPVALVGDAAHTVHPMAGQGLNLGLSDVKVLVDCLQRSHASGMDLLWGLSDYSSQRHVEVSTRLGGIHALSHVFAAQHPVWLHLKSLGLNAIQQLGPLRRPFVQAATSLSNR